MFLRRSPPAMDRKGIRLIFLNLDTEVGPYGVQERQRKRTRRHWHKSWVEFSFLYERLKLPGKGSPRERERRPRKAPCFLRCPVHLCQSLKILGRQCDSRARPYRYPQQVSKVNSL